MLATEELDAVSIATPETARRTPAVAAARKGLAMMLEKPLGRTFGDVDALVSELRSMGTAPAVNFILHADPRFAPDEGIGDCRGGWSTGQCLCTPSRHPGGDREVRAVD